MPYTPGSTSVWEPDEVDENDLVKTPLPATAVMTPAGIAAAAGLAGVAPGLSYQIMQGGLDNMAQRSREEDAQVAAMPAAEPSPTGAMAPPPGVVPPPVAVPPPAPRPTRTPGAGGVPQASKLEGDLQRAESDKIAAAEKETAAAKATAGAESSAAESTAKAHREDAARLAARSQAAEAESAKLSAAADAEDQKYKSMGYKDFWSTATVAGIPGTATGARILGVLSMALGAAGSAFGKTPNYAMEMINKRIDESYQQQRDAILKQRDIVSEARGRAKDAKAEKLLALEAWRKNAYELTEAEGKAMIAKMGPQAAEAKGAALLAELREKSVESKLALDKGIAMIANTRADTALKGAEIGKVRAESDKLKAEAAAGGKDSGRAATTQINKAQIATQMADDFATPGFNRPLSEKAKKIIQDNALALKQISESHGASGYLGTKAARALGAPKSLYDGLTEEEAQIAQAQRLAAQKAAAIVYTAGGGKAMEELVNEFDPTLPGGTPSTQKIAQMRNIMKTAAALGGKYTGIAEAGKASNYGGAPNAPSALPPGAIPGTMNGKRGYALGGKFYPLGDQ